MPENWIAVACAEHVRIGLDGGFMQVNHGRRAPLERVRPADRVVYYSPSEKLRQPDGLQSFTAIGQVAAGVPYQATMHNGRFHPWRRDVDWCKDTHTARIRPLLEQLEFSRGNKNWGYPLRLGLIRVSAHDMGLIATAMRADPAGWG